MHEIRHGQIRRGSDRMVSTYDGVVSRHSFSFGVHYDPQNVSFGALVCHNEDSLEAGHGYDDHPHTDLEIVTWVLEGELRHNSTVTAPHAGADRAALRHGQVQVLGAGSGITHAEIAAPVPTRFVQLWVRPDEAGLQPRVLREDLSPGATWSVVPGIRSSRCQVAVARLDGSATLDLPDGASHLFVCSGSITLPDGETLLAGDALRTTTRPGSATTAAGDLELTDPTLAGSAELLLVTDSQM